MSCLLSADWRRRVEAAYSEPHRHYHTMAHLEQMFAEAARLGLPLPREVEWAIWFHDFVYDPRSAANEEDSARVARVALAEMGEEPAAIERVAQLILATKHGASAAAPHGGLDSETALLISLDLAILAAPDAAYAVYVEQVRAEYAQVPEEMFRAGRAAFMRKFLESPAIFPHPAFAGYEVRARVNIERELGRLLPDRPA